MHETARNGSLFATTGGLIIAGVIATPFIPGVLLVVPAMAMVAMMPFCRSVLHQWRRQRRIADEATISSASPAP
jgi:hypothetical protein